LDEKNHYTDNKYLKLIKKSLNNSIYYIINL